MKYVALLAALTLLACGVDGPPIKPGTENPPKGLSISGRAEVGVAKSW